MNTTDDWIDKVKDNNATIIHALEILNLSTLYYDDLLVMLNGYHGIYMMYINNILLACTEYCTECCTACYLHVCVYMQPSHVSTFSLCSCASSLCYYLLHHLLSLSCAHGNQCPVRHVHLGWKHLSTLPTLAQTFCGPFRTSSLCWYVQWCFIYRPHKINFLFWFAYVIRCNMQYSACNHSVYTTCTQYNKKRKSDL